MNMEGSRSFMMQVLPENLTPCQGQANWRSMGMEPRLRTCRIRDFLSFCYNHLIVIDLQIYNCKYDATGRDSFWG